MRDAPISADLTGASSVSRASPQFATNLQRKTNCKQPPKKCRFSSVVTRHNHDRWLAVWGLHMTERLGEYVYYYVVTGAATCQVFFLFGRWGSHMSSCHQPRCQSCYISRSRAQHTDAFICAFTTYKCSRSSSYISTSSIWIARNGPNSQSRH